MSSKLFKPVIYATFPLKKQNQTFFVKLKELVQQTRTFVVRIELARRFALVWCVVKRHVTGNHEAMWNVRSLNKSSFRASQHTFLRQKVCCCVSTALSVKG